VVFRHPGRNHYQRLIEAARSRLADLELDYGVEKSKVDSVRSRLFGALRPYYQERDRLRLLIQYRLDHTLMELRALYEHLQARILELIESLDTLHASPDYEVFLFAEKDAAVIDTIAAAQQEELAGEVPF
jgi:homoserine trans-succinylase